MLYEHDTVHPRSTTSCDDVIDDIIRQILALKFCDFYAQNRKNRRKFVANNNLKFNKEQIRVKYDVFSITSDSKKLKFSNKKFSTAFTTKRYAKTKAMNPFLL